MTATLLDTADFPRFRYDDDIDSLIEDTIQDMFLRLHAKDEPNDPVVRWPGFFYNFLKNIIREKRSEAFTAHEAGWEKHVGSTFGENGVTLPQEQLVPDPAISVDALLSLPEIDADDELRIIDPRFWQYTNEELPKIADDRCRDCFRTFVTLVWHEGRTRRAAWKEVKGSCHGDRWATFCRWQRRLGFAVMKRWASEGTLRERAS